MPLLNVGNHALGRLLANCAVIDVQIYHEPRRAAVSFCEFVTDCLFERIGDGICPLYPVIDRIELKFRIELILLPHSPARHERDCGLNIFVSLTDLYITVRPPFSCACQPKLIHSFVANEFCYRPRVEQKLTLGAFKLPRVAALMKAVNSAAEIERRARYGQVFVCSLEFGRKQWRPAL